VGASLLSVAHRLLAMRAAFPITPASTADSDDSQGDSHQEENAYDETSDPNGSFREQAGNKISS
jgi:hypothetical protein